MPPWIQPTLEAPGFELLDQVVEGVFELREEEQPPIGVIEEALLLGAGLSAWRAWPRRSSLRPPGPARQARVSSAISSRTCAALPARVMASSISSRRSRSSFLHLVQIVPVREGRGVRCEPAAARASAPARAGGRDSRGSCALPGCWRPGGADRGPSGSQPHAPGDHPSPRRGHSGASRSA